MERLVLDSEDSPEGSEDVDACKLAVVARSDLGMTAGKLAAQVGHAVHQALGECEAARLERWEADGSRIVVLEEAGADGLRALRTRALAGGVAASEVLDEGLTEVEDGECTVLAVGPDLSVRVDEVTGLLALFRSRAEEESEAMRSRLAAAEAEVTRIRTLARAPLPELRPGEVWLEKALPPDGSSSPPIVPELFEQWCWEGDPDVLPLKWSQAVEESCEGSCAVCALQPWTTAAFDPEGAFFITHRSDTAGIALAASASSTDSSGEEVGLVAGWGVRTEYRRRGIGLCLLRLCLQRHAQKGRSRVLVAVNQEASPGAWRLLTREGFEAPSA